MDFKVVDKKYRATPFWSWNDKLDVDETRRQVRMMDQAGIGGFMMHARGGLLTEYMSDEWFDNIKAAIDEAHTKGMHPWAYDENGWPSGFAGGKVTALGKNFHQKILKSREIGTVAHENSILVRDNREYYYDVNPYYIDVLDENVVARFIKEVYEVYCDKCGNTFEGFFTDEPQMMSNTSGFPWSLILPDAFNKEYGYSLVDNLDALFLKKENSASVRRDYWHLVTRLFSNSFFKQIGDWCSAHGYGFTGHLMMEDTLLDQIRASGASMPHYEYFSHPGMDWLGRRTNEDLTAKQVGSAAAQMGKSQVLSETFALCGHNVSFTELKGIYEQQLVRGINLLCTHLQGYTNKGKRKRDYPPALYFQQPWWRDAKRFFDSMARIGMILSEGEIVADTLLLHAQTSAWELYDGDPFGSCSESIKQMNNQLLSDMRALEDKHILYHLGDQIMMERHARVEDGKLVIGQMSYSTVIVPEYVSLLPKTVDILEQFEVVGGKILKSTDLIAPNPITSVNHLTFTMRHYPDFDVYYFVNTKKESVSCEFAAGNLIVDIETGEIHPFSGKATIGQFESILLLDTHEKRADTPAFTPSKLLDLSGEWSVKGASYNSITLDRCDYRINSGEWKNNIYVLDILPRLNELKCASHLEQRFKFVCQSLSDEMFLVTETPEKFDIYINDKKLIKNDIGYFRDTSFRMLPIREHLSVGENEIRLLSKVEQSEGCYSHIDKSWSCETMRNCLAFDTEIEQIYIVGNFGVRLDDTPTELERDAYRIKNQPVITSMPNVVDISQLDFSGFPTFAGELVLNKRIYISDTKACVKLKGRGISSIHLSVNGKYVACKMWAPYIVDISDYLHEGENLLELTLVGNLRNMQGPFHMKEGESYHVSPPSFYREHNVITASNRNLPIHSILESWDDDICLVHYGLDVTL